MRPFSSDKEIIVEITGQPGRREMMPEHSGEMLMIMEDEPSRPRPGPRFSDEYSSRMAGDEMDEPMPMEEVAPEGDRFQEVVKAAAELRNMADRLESMVTVADLPKMAGGGMAYNPAVVAEEGPEMVIPGTSVGNPSKAPDLRSMANLRKGAMRLIKSSRMMPEDVPGDIMSLDEKRRREGLA